MTAAPPRSRAESGTEETGDDESFSAHACLRIPKNGEDRVDGHSPPPRERQRHGGFAWKNLSGGSRQRKYPPAHPVLRWDAEGEMLREGPLGAALATGAPSVCFALGVARPRSRPVPPSVGFNGMEGI